LRDEDNYDRSIKLYSEVLSKIKKDHELYPKVLDRRGTAYERIGNWELAEEDLTLSLEILPDQAYTINYLAYSWIEKEMNTRKALTMLKKANSLKRNDGYITDSLGWALYKLKNFSEAELYLQRATTLMPEDPIVNDHFADCLWMNNKKIQARYYWKYVLTLEDIEKELRQKIENKLLFGVEKS
jgi:tetratricopeptide (TPR) repeat protein